MRKKESVVGKILTVSIAAYNVEEYIEKALDSLLDPKINDKIEILVCDDGGQDSTLDIAKKYAERYPNTVIPIHKNNGGYGSVLNTNIKHATGKYFKILDGDDWFNKSEFVKFVILLEEIDADYVINERCDYYEPEGVYEQCIRYDDILEGSYQFNDFEFKSFIGMAASTFRTSLLKGLPVKFTEHSLYTDNEFVIYTIPYVDTIYFSHYVVYVYQHGRDEASNSKRSIINHTAEHENIFWHVYDVYKELDKKESAKRQFVRINLIHNAAIHYNFLSYFSPSKENLNAMVEFRNKLTKKCPEVIPLAEEEGFYARLFLKHGRFLYPFMHLIHLIVECVRKVKRRLLKSWRPHPLA